MNIEEVVQRVVDVVKKLRRAALPVMGANVVGALLLTVGLVRFGVPALVVVVLALFFLVPLFALWQFRSALMPVLNLPDELAARSGTTEDLGASLRNVTDAVTEADKSAMGMVRLVRQLKTEVDEVRETDAGAIFDGVRAIQPARLTAAAGATGLAFGALFVGAIVCIAGLLFG